MPRRTFISTTWVACRAHGNLTALPRRGHEKAVSTQTTNFRTNFANFGDGETWYEERNRSLRQFSSGWPVRARDCSWNGALAVDQLRHPFSETPRQDGVGLAPVPC